MPKLTLTATPLDWALAAISRLEASLAEEHGAEQSAVNSTNLLDTLTNFDRAIAEESEEMDALERISPGMSADERLNSRIISWLSGPIGAPPASRALYCRPAQLDNGSVTAARRGLEHCSGQPRVGERHRRTVGLFGYPDLGPGPPKLQLLSRTRFSLTSTATSSPVTGVLLAEAFPDFVKHHIFLSPGGQSPNLERDREYWQPASYSAIHDAIQLVLETGVAEPNANALLQIYATTIRRNVMPETSIDLQARRIYLEHREALDRILANKPNWIEENQAHTPGRPSPSTPPGNWIAKKHSSFAFVLPIGTNFPSSQTGTGWAPSSYALLLLQLRFDDETPYLDLGLSTAGPENAGIRPLYLMPLGRTPRSSNPPATPSPMAG